ncbi:MAG: AMP-binding protein [Pseudomonadota bacterium]
MATDNPIRCLLGMVGTDVHSKGIRTLASWLRDEGVEVIYLGEHNTVPGLVNALVQEDADVLGMSFSSAGYLDYVARVQAQMRERGVADVPVMVGGQIHPEEHAVLREMGVAGIFGPGTTKADVLAFLHGLPRRSDGLTLEAAAPATDDAAYVRSRRAYEPVDTTLGDLLRRMAREVPDRVALKMLRDPATGEQRSWTYAQVLHKAESAAQRLLQHFAPGEHVTLWAANCPEWLFVQFGAALAGLVLVAVSPASRSHELGYVLQQSDSVGVVHARQLGTVDAAALLATLRPQLPRLRHTQVLEDWGDFPALPGPARALPEVRPQQAAMIQYTSGTTGKPKGAMLSHRALVNGTGSVESAFQLPQGSSWLTTVPMYTTSGCVFTTLSTMWNRGTQVLLPGFSPEGVFRAVTEERVNWIPLVPTMAIAVLDHPARAACDFSSVQVVVAGGSAVAPALVERIERELGVDFMMIFGQTESSAAVCLSMRQDTVEHRTATIGYPIGGMEVRICDPATGQTLRLGEVGEICMRGPSTMLGYYNMPEATAQALDAQGWLHSGDLGVLQADGYPKITGRLKEMIIRGGSNIYPRELEDVLSTHPAVADCAAFGVPDQKYGELVAVAVRARPGQTADADALRQWVRERCASYKVPTHVWVVEQFPLTPSGKVQKFALRDQFLAQTR